MSRPKPGKAFEQALQRSVPDDTYCYRLRDCAGWGQGDDRRFTPRNGYDFILYRDGMMVAAELKSTNGTSIRFDAINAYQRNALTEADEKGVAAGVLVEWRREERHTVIWVPISEWVLLEMSSDKKSMNLRECWDIGVPVPCERIRTRYKIDVNSLLKQLEKRRVA